jgi:Fur family transcriptional regulator, peroxide stress response regulator
MIRKRSKEKQAILQFLRTANSHPTADAVYTEMRKETPNISLGTVYRNLRLLKEEGEIAELELAGSLSRFDGFTHPHYHFRCEKCSRIFDLNEAYDTTLNERIASETGFNVSGHLMEFRGLCHDCQPNNQVPGYLPGQPMGLSDGTFPGQPVIRPAGRL